ncbi:MAG: carbon-nitrogen hydrolase family protein [Alphaproteobacteria bacterium]|nr:carbon-nitrogen hydrolase family protein [Alphaproteobacteria bacterium]MBU0795218.1 carbon-nitrogen hydrolase family protein [Alphaproteobacteria bacterium]MBU0876660.1 carbon-nitrogen hydrolase family protein [Alphaproteobacteria bacterium]MBU1769362.1 carbon-nitrogen hydrolase family protein [Alphaproteobacteria bacterium]
MPEPFTAAVVQAASQPQDSMASALKAADLIRDAASKGARLIVFPEAFLGGYPKGASFGTPVGMRRPEGREDYRRYHAFAIDLDGPEVSALAEATAETGAFVVIGVIERDGGTVYCTALFLDGENGLIAKHRKLMPTGAERLIWGFGDGSTMPVIDTPLGRIGAVICWENYMPMLRMAMFDQGITLYCAPTADDRDTWASSMRHVALEGRCFVLSACQHITRGAYPADYDCSLGDDPDTVLLRGGSMIVGPLGAVLAGPDFSGETILYATIDPAEIVRGKYDFDVTGHYARADIFNLTVDVAPKRAVRRAGEV